MYRRQIGRERGGTCRPVRTPSPKRATPRRTPQHRAVHNELVICFGPAAAFIAVANNSPVSLDRAGVPTIPFDSGVRPPRSKSRTTSVRVSSVGIRLRKRSVARIRIIEPLKLTNPVLGQPRQQVEQDRKRDPGGIAVHLVLIEPNVLKLAFIRSTRSIRSARESVSAGPATSPDRWAMPAPGRRSRVRMIAHTRRRRVETSSRRLCSTGRVRMPLTPPPEAIRRRMLRCARGSRPSAAIGRPARRASGTWPAVRL